MFKIVCLSCVVTALSSSVAFADTNPYVDLYFQRLKIAEVQVLRQQAQTRYEHARMQRLDRLKSTGSISTEEYETQVQLLNVSQMTEKEYEAHVAEATALHRLAIARTEAGQDMPICTR